MGVTAILQARMSSSRLPGKVMADLVGLPLIHQQLIRISACTKIDTIVVATSTEESDDELAKYVDGAGYNVFRGSLEDVLERFSRVLRMTGDETCVRLTADCPLSDPEIIDRVITEFLAGSVDYASNTIERSYPRGLDVEVIKSDVIHNLNATSDDPSSREHVTYGIYANPSNYTLVNVSQNPSYAKYRWTVDTQEDLHFVRKVFEVFSQSGEILNQKHLINWLELHPDEVHLEPDVH